ncbi:MAG TPA: glycosyltransferase family 4 protein [Polyangiaceae bacterium]|jgi:glycosyltransferase involved in cell wall biosynthesis|nr:glycosyltransferase family 4 protein [Polyangiaceae bacterium]
MERVLVTLDPLGGVFAYALTLARHLAEDGVQVLLASMGGALSAEQRAEVTSIRSVTLAESDFALEWMDDPWRDVATAGEWLLALEREFRPSVVHLNGYAHARAGFRAPVVVVAHSCVASWWRAVWNEPAPPRYDTYRASVEGGLRAAAAVVAPSAAMLRALSTEYRAPLANATVIHNGVPAERFRGAVKEPFVLASGRLWDRAKNLGDISARAGELCWPFLLAGESVSPDGAALSYPANVKMLGRLSPEQMADVMSRAALFVHPALYEPFGLAPLEAALSGCALVLADIDSLREIWGDAAEFVAPRNVRAFLDVANRLARSADEREELARRARARALSFSARTMTNAYSSLYRSLVERQPRNTSIELGRPEISA